MINTENYLSIKNTIPETVQLIAVSKTKPIEDIAEAYLAGQRLFGENKAQELKVKYEALPKDIEWHFIGHLQSNKIKYIAPFVSLIHSIDSFKLLEEINRYAQKNNRTISCLLQFHIATEDTKFGFDMNECEAMLQSAEYKSLAHVEIAGVMGMATYTENEELIRKEFKQLFANFSYLKEKHFADKNCFKEVSMGMTGDYPLAIEEGSTMIRIGSAIFGER